MLLRFNKSTGIILFTIGLISSLLFKRYAYGFLLTVFSFVVGLQYTLLRSTNPSILQYINWTALPGYFMLGLVPWLVCILITSLPLQRRFKRGVR